MTDETEETDVYIGCMTVKMGEWNPSSVAEGCIVKQCGTCGSDIHLAPSSQKLLATKPQAHLICLPCIKKKVIEDKAEFGEGVEFAPVPGAIDEVLKHIAKRK